MPLVRVYFPEDSLSDDQRARLVEGLTHELLMIEGGEDNRQGRAIAWVFLQPMARDQWAIGGHFDDTYVQEGGRFLVEITVMEGGLARERRTEVARRVNDLLMSTVGVASEWPAGASAWVVMREVPEGWWAAGGHLGSVLDTARFVGLPDDDPRVEHARAVLDARARSRAAFDSPG